MPGATRNCIPKRSKAAARRSRRAILAQSLNQGNANPTARLKGKIRGRGGFFGKVWEKVKRPLKAVASAAGTAALGSLRSQFLGKGAYTSAFTIRGNRFATKVGTAIEAVGEFGVRVTQRESLATIYSSTDWVSRIYRLNPGLDDSFPWLSKIASNFQQYRFDQVIYTYESSCPESVGQFTSVGTVLICPIINPDQPIPSNQMMMEQTQFCTAAKPTQSVDVPVECDPKEGGAGIKPIRVGDLANGVYHDYDAGYLQVCTVNQPAANVAIGRLYVTYTVTLFNPIYRGSGAGANYAHYRGLTGSTVVWPSSASTSTCTKLVDQIGLSLGSAANSSTINFPAGSAGNFLISIFWVSATGVSMGTLTPSYSNCSLLNAYWGGGYAQAPQNGASTGQASYNTLIAITDTSKAATFTLTLASGVLPWTSGTVEVIVSQIDPVAV